MNEHTKFLFRRLKQKFFPKPSVFLIYGKYELRYEESWRWLVGFCDTREEANRYVEQLEGDLERVRGHVLVEYIIMKTAESKTGKLSFYELPEEDREKLTEDWLRAHSAYQEKLEQFIPTMLDQSIRYPTSTIFAGHKDEGIRYYIEEAIKIKE